jgi:hypothetical protein
MDYFETPPILHTMYLFIDLHLTVVQLQDSIQFFSSNSQAPIRREVTLVFSKITFGRLIAYFGSGSNTHLAYLRRKRAGKENKHHG